MLKRIDAINRGIAIAAGAADDKLPARDRKSPAHPLVNDKDLVARVNPSLEALLGKGKVVDQFPPVMGSKDFHEVFPWIGKVPYAFILVGVAPRHCLPRRAQLDLWPPIRTTTPTSSSISLPSRLAQKWTPSPHSVYCPSRTNRIANYVAFMPHAVCSRSTTHCCLMPSSSVSRTSKAAPRMVDVIGATTRELE